MKNLTVLIGVIALVLSSCGTHNALRLVKTNPNQQIVQTTQVDPRSEDLTVAEDIRSSNAFFQTSAVLNDVDVDNPTPEMHAYPDTTSTEEEPEMTSEDASEAAEQAQRSEKTAKAAKNLGIAGIVVMWLGLLSFVALPLMIASLICYIKANRARYTTEKGVKYLKAAKKLLIFYGIVVALAILLTIVLFLLFL
jgi:hypothetical protein